MGCMQKQYSHVHLVHLVLNRQICFLLLRVYVWFESGNSAPCFLELCMHAIALFPMQGSLILLNHLQTGIMKKILSTPTALIILICALLENLSATLLISCPLSCYYLNHLVARGEKQCSSLDLLSKQKSFILQVFSECIYAIAATVKR